MDLEKLQYPIGRFKGPLKVTPEDRSRYIDEIAALPRQLSAAVTPLNDQQLETTYRPDGWTLRQVVHHLADSHVNSYVRFKWALTESAPRIKAYSEKDWAKMADAQSAPVDISLEFLAGLHNRWVWMLNSMHDQDWKKYFIHPETNREVPLDFNLALYAWHGKHHLGHIINTKEIHGW